MVGATVNCDTVAAGRVRNKKVAEDDVAAVAQIESADERRICVHTDDRFVGSQGDDVGRDGALNLNDVRQVGFSKRGEVRYVADGDGRAGRAARVDIVGRHGSTA